MIKRLLCLCLLSLSIVPMLMAQSVAPAANPRRAALEQQFRAQSATLAQQRLGLTDAQLAQLEQTNARFAPQMNQLVAQERETRQQLRLEMTRGNQANQQHVSDLLDNTVRLQKQRIALVEAEQKDLARFLTPTQRAGYIALQAQFRMRAQELMRRNGGRKALKGQPQSAPDKHLP
jgi:periplasmic protein CpxP/Spy